MTKLWVSTQQITMTNVTTRLSKVEDMIASIANSLGIGNGNSSRKGKALSTSPKQVSKQREDDDENTVTLQVNDKGGRVKLPARMFRGKPSLKVDGVKFNALDSDMGRSAPINPRIVFDAKAGSTLTFTHVSGRDWTVEVSGSRKAAGSKGPKFDKQSSKSGEVSEPRFEYSGNQAKDRKRMIEWFGDIALTNYHTKGFEKNQNIIDTASFDVDARVLFTTTQNQRFRSARKRLGLRLSEAVELLNAYVYES